jgi:hypothetical protein
MPPALMAGRLAETAPGDAAQIWACAGGAPSPARPAGCSARVAVLGWQAVPPGWFAVGPTEQLDQSYLSLIEMTLGHVTKTASSVAGFHNKIPLSIALSHLICTSSKPFWFLILRRLR